jgi:hypothetical protein
MGCRCFFIPYLITPRDLFQEMAEIPACPCLPRALLCSSASTKPIPASILLLEADFTNAEHLITIIGIEWSIFLPSLDYTNFHLSGVVAPVIIDWQRAVTSWISRER